MVTTVCAVYGFGVVVVVVVVMVVMAKVVRWC